MTGMERMQMDAAEYRDNQPEAKSAVSEAYEWVESFLVPLLAFLLIFTFFARLATVNGISMLPTLHNGERLILQQVGLRRSGIRRRGRRRPLASPTRTPIVKRVIGKEGDVIFIDFASGEVWRKRHPARMSPTSTNPRCTSTTSGLPGEGAGGLTSVRHGGQPQPFARTAGRATSAWSTSATSWARRSSASSHSTSSEGYS